MRTLLALLLVLCLLPLAAPASGSTPVRVVHPFTASFEFDETAARPPGELDGFLVLRGDAEPVTVRGQVIVEPTQGRHARHVALAEPPSQEEADGDEAPRTILEVDEELQPFATVRIPLTVPVERVGTFLVNLLVEHGEQDGGWRTPGRVDPVEVVGLAPVSVAQVAPEPGVHLISVPRSPGELTVTLTALPGSDLTDLRLTANHATEVEVGDLAPGESFTATLSVVTRPGDGGGGVHRTSFMPQLSGVVDGEPFAHALYRDAGGRHEHVRPDLFIAHGSTLFPLPPGDARLAEPTAIELVALNTGAESVRVRGRVVLTMEGLPDLEVRFPVDVRVGPGAVETLRLDWTPSAAGSWRVEVHHDLNRRGLEADAVQVTGPIAGVDFQLFNEPLARGTTRSVPVGLTASEEVRVDGLALTSSRAPSRGLISIHDLFRVDAAAGRTLEPGEPTTFQVELTPRATGSHHLLLVVETPDGPSVHNVGGVVVNGSTGGWALAWSPTVVVWVLLGVHVSWRQWWVR